MAITRSTDKRLFNSVPFLKKLKLLYVPLQCNDIVSFAVVVSLTISFTLRSYIFNFLSLWQDKSSWPDLALCNCLVMCCRLFDQRCEVTICTYYVAWQHNMWNLRYKGFWKRIRGEGKIRRLRKGGKDYHHRTPRAVSLCFPLMDWNEKHRWQLHSTGVIDLFSFFPLLFLARTRYVLSFVLPFELIWRKDGEMERKRYKTTYARKGRKPASGQIR